MKGAEPYGELKSSKGILFIHGFTGSPHEHRRFAEKFAEAGYSVSLPLLAGHGTSPKDLAKTSWQDWYHSARSALFELKKRASEIVVVGLSMGGTLALHLASHYEVNGVAALAAPFYLNDNRLKLLPIAKYFIKFLDKSGGVDIKDPEQKKNAVHYNSRPLKAVEQLLLLFDHVRNDLSDIHVPVLLAYSRKDHVVPFSNLEFIETRLGSNDVRKLELTESYHGLTLDIEREKVFNTLRIFIEDIIGKP